MYKFGNLNQALIGMSKEIIKQGKWRETRGFRCLEIPNPVLICIENPTDRYINIPERKWNKQFGWVESLWLASGTNHLDIATSYIKNMATFSDDGQFVRAGYGPRIRAFSGISVDYAVDDPKYRNVFSGNSKVVDQLRFVVESFKRDINTRQALISIHDPAKDDFGSDDLLKVTKDQPCCRTIQFMVVDGKLDCTLTIRSNDILWGFSAVNVFNFTLLQEYVAKLINIPVGKYYHFVNNLHVYEDKFDLIKQFSELNPNDYESEFGVFSYEAFVEEGYSLEKFDKDVNLLFRLEKELRGNPSNVNVAESGDFYYSMFEDWFLVLYNYWTKERELYINPYLNKLFYGN